MATPILPENVSYANAINTALGSQPDISSLVPVAQSTWNGDSVQTVNARSLHTFLEVKSKFADWVTRRIEQYEFVQGIDFVTILNSENSPPSVEYHITLDMAKELSMVERNHKGKEARQYFIACEKKLRQVSSPAPQIPLIELQERRVNLCERVLSIAKAFDDDMLQIMALDTIKNTLLLSSGASNGTDVVSEFQTAEVLESLGMSTLEIRSRRACSGKLLSSAFRSEFGKEPEKTKRMIDGAMRDVNIYPTSWFDSAKEIISQYYNKQPMVA